MSHDQQAPNPYGVPENEPDRTPHPSQPAAQLPQPDQAGPPSSSPRGSADEAASVLADPHPRHRGRVASTAAVLTLAVSLAGWGWFASANAREGWWAFGEHQAAVPDEQGWATVDTLSVRLTDSEIETTVDDVEPPGGFVYLAIELDVEALETEQTRICSVEVQDTLGRLFLAGREVPNGDPYESSLTCGTSDPEEDPVPTTASLLVLVPEDAELTSVRVSSVEFPPAAFIELPLP